MDLSPLVRLFAWEQRFSDSPRDIHLLNILTVMRILISAQNPLRTKVAYLIRYNENIFTARKGSLRRLGYVFTRVCLSRGGQSAPGGHCLLQVGGACSRGVSAPRGVCSGVGGVETPRDGYCCGRYASYWNAFLFIYLFISFLPVLYDVLVLGPSPYFSALRSQTHSNLLLSTRRIYMKQLISTSPKAKQDFLFCCTTAGADPEIPSGWGGVPILLGGQRVNPIYHCNSGSKNPTMGRGGGGSIFNNYFANTLLLFECESYRKVF